MAARPEAFQHEAFFYQDEGSFLAGLVPFILDGLEHDEAVLVAVPPKRLEALRSLVGDDGVHYLDMIAAGRNPATIIPVWHQFIDKARARGAGARGIGEPVWHGRSELEIVECHHHEALLNRAFHDGPPWRLLCPYDARALGDEVVAKATATHPVIYDGDRPVTNPAYTSDLDGGLRDPLPPPPPHASTLAFDAESLSEVREAARSSATRAGLSCGQIDDVVLAVNELATNSIRHAGGAGTLALWTDGAQFSCQVSDPGQLTNPLVGRRTPSLEQAGGRGVWMVHHLADLTHVRSGEHGTTIRLHFGLRSTGHSTAC